MKKALVLLLILVMALGLCACGKTPVTGAEFRSRMEEQGLEVSRNSTLVDSDETVLDAYVGSSQDGRLTVRYYELSSESEAKSSFWSSQVLDMDGIGITSKITSPHYGYCSKNNGEKILITAYVENTLLIGFGDSDQAQILKDLFKAVGYK